MLFRKAIRTLLLGLTLPVLFSASAYAQGAAPGSDMSNGKAYGAWKVKCDTPPGSASERCIVVQNVVDDQSPDITLVVSIYKTADGKSQMMRVVAPLGVLLPSGLGLRIDETDIGRVGFVRCFTSGCAAEVRIEDGLLDQLKNGKTAMFIVFKTPEQGVGVPIVLDGFSAAYDNLPNVAQ
ncbi:invasion associated locus B family protein [Microvirga sp. W0021]|uniref:Invasion associated locus B family protein n=1 Tax=Hohaiivirga grylli TaxID=3133970 RepID=A0ABV0BLE2_9HYPH